MAYRVKTHGGLAIVTVDSAIEAVSRTTGFTPEEIRSRHAKDKQRQARALAVTLASEQGYSRATLGSLFGVSQSTIQRDQEYCRGMIEASPDHASLAWKSLHLYIDLFDQQMEEDKV